MPVTMTEPLASPNQLKIIRCSCTTGCKTMTCLCCKHGLKFTDSCKKCCGASGINCQEVDLDVFFPIILIFGSQDRLLTNRFLSNLIVDKIITRSCIVYCYFQQFMFEIAFISLKPIYANTNDFNC